MKNKRKQKGISLLELILALAVFLIGIASVAHIYVGAYSLATYNLDNLQAVKLSQEGIEQARATRRQGGVLEDEVETIILDDMEFERSILVDHKTKNGVDLAVIESVVKWSRLGRENSVSQKSIFTEWNIN